MLAKHCGKGRVTEVEGGGKFGGAGWGLVIPKKKKKKNICNEKTCGV